MSIAHPAPGLTAVIPALNEAGNLEAVVRGVLAAAHPRFADYEVLVFDDGSTDGTGEIADRLARADAHVRVVHNPVNRGLGYNFARGVDLARFDRVTMVPGDNEIDQVSIAGMLAEACRADLVIAYPVNSEIRPVSRRVISRMFVLGMNLLFGRRLRYYNGPCVLRTDLLRVALVRSPGFAYMAATLVRMLRAGATYVEAPFRLRPRRFGRSAALRPRNVWRVFATVARLAWEVRVLGRKVRAK